MLYITIKNDFSIILFQDQLTNKIYIHHTQVMASIEQHIIRRIVLCGMSMGGLIASVCAEKLSAENHVKVEMIITISSPLQGAPLLTTCLNRIFRTKRHQQMTPNSEFLLQLNRQLAQSSISILTFGSESDIHVPSEFACPTQQSNPAQQRTHISYRIPGHIAITLYPPVFQHIRTVYHNQFII